MSLIGSRSIVRPAALAAALALTVAATSAARDEAKEGGAFVVTFGRDTMAIESYVRMDTVLTGTSVLRNQAMTQVRRYTLTLDKSGNLARYEVTVYPAGADETKAPLIHLILTPMGDAIDEIWHDAKGEHTLHLNSGRATLPFMNVGFGMWEAVTMRGVRSGKDSIAFPMIFNTDTTIYTTSVKRSGKDSVVINSIYGTGRAKIDAQGRILGYAAPGSTQQVVVTRVANADPMAFATAYAQRPLPLSPTDTVRASAGAANLTLIYGRPSMRGRMIFGEVVPWDVVWRTGANAATTFITDKEITIGGTTVPAGEYTIFSLPSKTGWKLIVSKKTKEWGTEYDPTADLARIEMAVGTLPQPVEMLTIAIAPQGAGASLSVSWDRTAASVPIKAK